MLFVETAPTETGFFLFQEYGGGGAALAASQRENQRCLVFRAKHVTVSDTQVPSFYFPRTVRTGSEARGHSLFCLLLGCVPGQPVSPV